MDVKEIIKIIFTHPYIDKKGWIFKADVDWNKTEITIDNDDDNYIRWHDGIWENGKWYNGYWENGIWKKGTWYDGRWKDGVWENGVWENGYWEKGYWYDGIWEKGTWLKGNIYNPKTKQYEPSELPPNKCKWSLSYGY